MAEMKTKVTKASVQKFVGSIKDEERRSDVETVVKLMEKATGAKPKMYGKAIVGFGSRTLKYDSGRELDWFVVGFSPRKADLTLYLAGGWSAQAKLMEKLGKHKTGKGCLYIKRLSDVDQRVLKQLIANSVELSSKSTSPHIP